MEFILFPWDRKRLRLHPPQAQNTVIYSGRTFLLRAQNGLLFFRDVADSSNTWAISTPLPLEVENEVARFPEFWQQEYQRGNIARFIVHHDEYLERNLTLFIKGDGTGFLRESWNRDDILFTHHISMHDLLEGRDEIVSQGIGLSSEQWHNALAGMNFPSGNCDSEENINWLCGSREQLVKLATWICHLEKAFKDSGEIELSVEAENSFARAHVCMVETKGKKQKRLWISLDERTDELVRSYSYNEDMLPLTRRFFTLFDLAFDENTPAGLYWEYRDYGQGRCADDPYSPSFDFIVPAVSLSARLTARQKLSQWLQGQWPASQIEALLDDETRAELPKREW